MRNGNASLAQEVQSFLLRDFRPRFGQLAEDFGPNVAWRSVRALGSELWLDTGNIGEITDLWTREFTAVTTNNTLLNREVQSGQYDQFILEAFEILKKHQLDERATLLEMAFMLNAHHALRLVEKFDAYVSVEEHTDLATEVAPALDYARRYRALCPERFYVKIPFTPAGLLATRLAAREGIAVNHTLGFSARQNYVIARIARPAFVNVFLGRLNSFVADNHLGDGKFVGERATVASQEALRELRRTYGLPTRQIAASFREAPQIRDLLGVDVLTMPAKAAKGFLDMNVPADQLVDRSRELYEPAFRPSADVATIGMDTLWDVRPELVRAVDELQRQDLDTFGPEDLIDFFGRRRCGDFMVQWTSQQKGLSREEGKIPRLENWRELLADRTIGLDSLMNLAGLGSFISDQQAMDDRVRNVLRQQLAHTK